MGEISAKTFRASDIISRRGGDEFTIFIVDMNLEVLPRIKERLLKYTTEYNRQSGKPYQISITIGAVPFKSAEKVTLEELINQADSLLYEQKKHKDFR
jgi:diguanylate cyclase (GGDEF)-like protein